MRFLRRIARNAALENFAYGLRERGQIAGPVADRMRLQPVKLVQSAVHRRVRNEMIHVGGILLVLRPGCFVGEGARAREGVMRGADRFRVRERLAAEFRGEPRREVFEGA